MARILIAEDDQFLSKMIVRALQTKGHTVDVATDGRQALSLFQTGTPDLVITDLLMPDCDGMELLMSLKKQKHTPPIIAISGGGRNSPHGYLYAARKMGAVLTLAKPFEMDQLLSAVDEAMQLGGAGGEAKRDDST